MNPSADFVVETPPPPPPPSPAAAPLGRMLESYSLCLELGRDFLTESLAGDKRDEDVDLDGLERFLNIRSDLLAVAEDSFQAVNSLERDPPGREDAERQALTRKVVAVLEEMTGLESDLSAFLHDRLKKIGDVITQLRRIQPVFQRYSHLGGDRGEPCRITRRE